MKCLSCDKVLSDKEATRKYASNPNVFVDLCDRCFVDVSDEIPTIEGKGTDDESAFDNSEEE